MKPINVTKILAPYWARLTPEEFLHKGTIIHAACLSILQEFPQVYTVPQIDGYIESFKEWKKLMVKEVIAVEPELINEELGISGHPDIIIRTSENKIALLDLKTCEPNMIVRAQLCAYLRLCNSKHKIEQSGIVRLYPDGKVAKTYWLSLNDRDWSAFLSALNCYRYFNQNNAKE